MSRPTRFTRRVLLTGSAALAGAAASRRLAFGLAAVSPAALAHDPRRPQYHLLPPANWLNDPNGPIYWRGKYHIFYQYAVDPAGDSPKLWAHAVSPDMVYWRHLPIALEPTAGGPDGGGVWSGSALADGDRVAMFYAAVVPAQKDQATTPGLRESQCLAFGSGRELTQWAKVPAAVIPAPPSGLDVTGFRDPAPWRDGDQVYMAIGSGIRGRGGCVLLYRSSVLRHWEYLHPLIQGDINSSDPALASDMWECPDFFPLGDKHVLIHSTAGKAFWQSGTLDRAAMTFHPERSGILDYGSFYAPKTQLDAHGHRILWGWITEDRTAAQMRAASWSGMMSLPRVLTLDADGNLRISVAHQVEQLQRERISSIQHPLAHRIKQSVFYAIRPPMMVRDSCGEIVCTFRRNSGPFEAALVSQTPDNEKALLACRFDPARPSEILIDNQPVPLGPGTSDAELRFYIDGSVIECFANGYGALTKRFYIDGSFVPLIAVHIGSNAQALKEYSTSQMTPISPDRLTI